MNIFKKFTFLTLFLMICLSAFSHAWATDCPKKDQMQTAIKDTFRRPGIIVKEITPGPTSGLCQILVEFNGQKKILYSDNKGIYLITGQIFDTKTKKNITQETVTELNRFTDDDMKKLETFTAFTVGEKGPSVYLVTDPQCPYCKKAEEELVPMAKKGQIKLHVLLFPLPFHKGAKEECISILCDNKGIEGLKNRYRSENQCDKGKKKIEDTMTFLKKKGISGTPTHIFPDGRYKSGVMKPEMVLENTVVKK